MCRHALRDDQWDRMKDLLPGSEGWVARQPMTTGCSWRRFSTATAPASPGVICRSGSIPIQVHTRFSRWAKSGVWARAFQHLAADPDNEYAMIDSTIVRAHQHSAGAQKKTVKTKPSGARGRTEHQDPRHGHALGNPTGIVLTGGEAHDLVGADHLLPQLQAEALIADKAFDAEACDPAVGGGRKIAVIPPKKGREFPRDYDRELYKAPSDSKFLRQAQAIPRHFHPLRQDREKLPRGHSPGRQPRLAQSRTGPRPCGRIGGV